MRSLTSRNKTEEAQKVPDDFSHSADCQVDVERTWQVTTVK